jgi:hypothetical protein
MSSCTVLCLMASSPSSESWCLALFSLRIVTRIIELAKICRRIGESRVQWNRQQRRQKEKRKNDRSTGQGQESDIGNENEKR